MWSASFKEGDGKREKSGNIKPDDARNNKLNFLLHALTPEQRDAYMENAKFNRIIDLLRSGITLEELIQAIMIICISKE